MNILHLAKGPAIPARRAEPGVGFLCYSWDSLRACEAAGLPARPWEDDFPVADAPAISAEAVSLAGAWYRDGGRDFTLFSGVSLGAAHEWLVWNLSIQPLAKLLTALDAAVVREGAKTLRCETSLPADWRAAIESFARARGLAFESVAHPGAGREIYSWQAPPPRLSAGKILAGRLLDAASRLRGGAGKPRALVSWYPSLDGLLDRDDAPFDWTLADFPTKKRIGAALRRGWRLQAGPWSAPSWDRAGREALAQVQADWRRLRDDAAYAAALSFRGTPLLPALRPALDELFTSRLEPLAWAARETARLLREEPPAVVLLPYDTPPYQRVLAGLARAAGVPTALLIHGLPFDVNYPFADRQCDELLVWGPEQRREYAAARPPRASRAVGNPGFDRHAGTARPAGGPIRRVLVLPRAKWADILVGSSNFEPERYAIGVAAALKAAGFADVVFRPHPAESPDYYREILGDSARVETAGSFGDAVAGADLVIGTYSTTLLEVMLRGKPLLCVNFTKGLDFAPPFDGRWGVDVLRSPAELEARLKRLTAEPAREAGILTAPYPKILAAYCGPSDGRAADRVLDALADLARRGRPAPEKTPA
ncbi:MAG: hypothetical protein M0D55_01895 [Elusimicrobiota bacterium]|nr:MAG: hypothetical protein M0D55_01895 [Elusimicrobiota bacterium]